MATDWANALDWGGAQNFTLPTEFEIARSAANWTDYRNGVGRFAPNAQNAGLLASLGYGGQALSDAQPDPYLPGVMGPQGWTDDALTWLGDQGYQLGVGHLPGTKAQGRAEYFGLLGPDGKFVQGQADPTSATSDSWGDMIAPFALMAAPFAASAMFGGAAAGGGAAGGAAAGGAAGGLAAAEGVTALGAGWSPAALGLTSGIAPAATAAEIAALGAGIPGAVGVGAGAAAGAGLAGAAGGGGVTATLPTQVITGASAGSAAGSALPTLGQVGGAIGGVSSAEQLFQQAADEALASSENYYQQNPIEQWMTDVRNVADIKGGGLLDYASTGFENLPNAPGASNIKDLFGTASNAVGGGDNLAALVGAGLGAASGGGTETSSRDPWSAAQPFLKNLLGDADAMRADMRANPFTPQQTQQYGQAFAGLDQARGALPGLMNWGQQAMQRQSTTPSYDQLFGGGLLGQQPQQPTAQAGGPGGLLGNTQQDRLKALMARGQGLMG